MSKLVFALMLALALAPPIYADELGPAYVALFHVQQTLAKDGGPNDQFYLAKMYEGGMGTKHDMDEAFTWYTRAAKGGNRLAKRIVANWVADDVLSQADADVAAAIASEDRKRLSRANKKRALERLGDIERVKRRQAKRLAEKKLAYKKAMENQLKYSADVFE
ncbi:MAG: hypothetical protein BMS9Abin36_0955 [Gammaproteobacteria bacterium]|nr:MAG: hypothetical protein BMS9Abin36_0955 [Gammaproteobacteria bacterium]